VMLDRSEGTEAARQDSAGDDAKIDDEIPWK
jgi:hypothetical protein